MAFNTLALLSIGRNLESQYGYGRFLTIYLVSGLFGNVLSLALRGPYEFSAGASGAIFGLIGAELGFYLFHRRQLGQHGREQRTQLLWLIGINLALGVTMAGINNLAHIGGFIAGCLLGYGLAPRYLPEIKAGSGVAYMDQATLLQRWWVLLVAMLLLVASTSGVIFAWRNYPEQMTTTTLRMQMAPYMFMNAGYFVNDYFGDGENDVLYEEPETILLEDGTECYYFAGYKDEYSEVDPYYDCYLSYDFLTGEQQHTIDVTSLNVAETYHATLYVWAYEGEMSVQVADQEGQKTSLRISPQNTYGSASNYVGIVGQQIELDIQSESGAEEVSLNLELTPIEEYE